MCRGTKLKFYEFLSFRILKYFFFIIYIYIYILTYTYIVTNLNSIKLKKNYSDFNIWIIKYQKVLPVSKQMPMVHTLNNPASMFPEDAQLPCDKLITAHRKYKQKAVKITHAVALVFILLVVCKTGIIK